MDVCDVASGLRDVYAHIEDYAVEVSVPIVIDPSVVDRSLKASRRLEHSECSSGLTEKGITAGRFTTNFRQGPVLARGRRFVGSAVKTVASRFVCFAAIIPKRYLFERLRRVGAYGNRDDGPINRCIIFEDRSSENDGFAQRQL
ncbi:MAG: hypothetical protein BRD44_02850 [Bacteroidetes bacterium QS_7_67_15]|nr:MAG: hypothetical protein BRD44_02850 [Bacteroidetes bacterium QS_7_67_15]